MIAVILQWLIDLFGTGIQLIPAVSGAAGLPV